MPLHPILKDIVQEKAKPFQVEDATWLQRNGRCILGHKTGMGKTLMALMGWSAWNTRRTLILGSKASMAVWKYQPERWVDVDAPVRIIDQPHVSDDFVKYVTKKTEPGIWMMTHDMFRRCMEGVDMYAKPEVDLLILEELHRVRNRKTLAYKQMCRLRFDLFTGMSATWATRGPQDLYAALHLIKPHYWKSYWKFVETFCYVERGAFGTDVFGVRNLTALKKELANTYKSRTWKEVGRQFPPVRREPLPLEMDKEQAAMYHDLETAMYTERQGKLIVTPTILSLATRLRQIAVCPLLLWPQSGVAGAGIDYILTGIEDDPHTVVFSWFKSALYILRKLLEDRGYKNIFMFEGGMDEDKLHRQTEVFKKTKGIALCTIGFAEGFRVDTAHKAYMLGWSWDPNQNIQSEGRLRAIDSELQEPALVDYIYMKDAPVDRGVLNVVNEKVVTVSSIFPDFIEQADKPQTLEDV